MARTLPAVLMRLVGRPTRGAAAYAYVGSPFVTLYPEVAGWINQRQFRISPPVDNRVADVGPIAVTPQRGRFGAGRTTRTSPLMPSAPITNQKQYQMGATFDIVADGDTAEDDDNG